MLGVRACLVPRMIDYQVRACPLAPSYLHRAAIPRVPFSPHWSMVTLCRAIDASWRCLSMHRLLRATGAGGEAFNQVTWVKTRSCGGDTALIANLGWCGDLIQQEWSLAGEDNDGKVSHLVARGAKIDERWGWRWLVYEASWPWCTGRPQRGSQQPWGAKITSMKDGLDLSA